MGKQAQTFRDRFEQSTGAAWPSTESELADQERVASILKQMANEIDQIWAVIGGRPGVKLAAPFRNAA